MAIRLTLRQLEYFIAVGETGSIAKASEKVNVSSPSVSVSISQLEMDLGVQLFVRKHAQGLTLTAGGRRVFEEAKSLISSAEGLLSIATDISKSISGPLNIGCFITIAPLILPEVRRSFQQLFPDVRVKQFEGDQSKLLNAVRNAEADVCLTYNMDIPKELEFITLAELPPYVMLSPSHPLAKHSSLSPEQLAKEPLVLLDLPSSSDYFLSMFKKSGFRPKIAERTQDMALTRSMVANGFGYSLANIKGRTEVSPDGKPLKFVPLSGGIEPIKLGLITGKEPNKPRIVSAFIQHCQNTINQDGIPEFTVG